MRSDLAKAFYLYLLCVAVWVVASLAFDLDPDGAAYLALACPQIPALFNIFDEIGESWRRRKRSRADG